MRLQGSAATQVGSIMSTLGLVLGLMLSLLITSVAISEAKPAGGPTVTGHDLYCGFSHENFGYFLAFLPVLPSGFPQVFPW